jgi:anti-anti-sigma factor
MTDFIQVQTDQTVNVVAMTLPEYLDSTDFDKLNESLLGLFDAKRPKGWVVDLSDVNYMGSAMLGMMVNFRQRVQSVKGKLVLCGVSPRLMEIIRTCCMDRLFPIAKTRADAIKMAK